MFSTFQFHVQLPFEFAFPPKQKLKSYEVFLLPAAQKSDLSMEVDKIVEEIGFPDWVVLSLIHSNLTTVHFQDFLKDLAYQHKPDQETK